MIRIRPRSSPLGANHFGTVQTESSIRQMPFLQFVQPDSYTLLVLDFEANGQGPLHEPGGGKGFRHSRERHGPLAWALRRALLQGLAGDIYRSNIGQLLVLALTIWSN